MSSSCFTRLVSFPCNLTVSFSSDDLGGRSSGKKKEKRTPPAPSNTLTSTQELPESVTKVVITLVDHDNDLPALPVSPIKTSPQMRPSIIKLTGLLVDICPRPIGPMVRPVGPVPAVGVVRPLICPLRAAAPPPPLAAPDLDFELGGVSRLDLFFN